ncbi:hypothetical protein AB3X10_10950 [Xanthomonas sp. DAR 80977]|nr:hypothetical protein [Burkholderia cepacia]
MRRLLPGLKVGVGLLIAQQNAMATKMQADADKEAQQAAAAAQLRQGSYRASPARTW